MTYYDAEIEYLESTSTQWIDTEIIPDATTGFEIKVVCSNNYDTYFIGLRNDSGNTRWGAGHSSYGFYWCYGTFGVRDRLNSLSATIKLNYLNDKKYVATNGSNTVDVLLPTLSFTPAYNIRLFGSAGVDASYSKWSGKIYYCQITQGSELIMDLIPVRIGSVGYMYDKVSDTLFGNVGTDSFTLGPDVAGWPGIEGTPKVSLLRRKLLQFMPKYKPNYFKLTAIESGDITCTLPAALTASTYKEISYSVDNGAWTTITNNSTNITITVPISAGHTVYWRGKSAGNSTGSRFNACVKFNSTGRYAAGGNVLSLLYDKSFEGQENVSVRIPGLFENSTTLIKVENTLLPSLKVGNYGYEHFFLGCTNLTNAPLLPATTFTSTYPYSCMFQNCKKLTTAPSLPATSLTQACYYNMFLGCTSLINAPELTATTMVRGCYQDMFNGCTNLVTAPDLPATTLAQECYSQMFKGCSKLKYIKTLAIDKSATNCMNNWVNGVQTTSGTFIRNPQATWVTIGNSGIPTNWTWFDGTESENDETITFVDAEVQRIMVAQWGGKMGGAAAGSTRKCGIGTSTTTGVKRGGYADGVIYKKQVETIVTINSQFYQNKVIVDFSDLNKLTSLTTIQSSSSGSNANRGFNQCTNLRYITFPNSLKTLGSGYTYGRGMFKGTALEEVYIPDSVTSMGENTFGDCSKLVSVRWSSNVPIPVYTGGNWAAGTFQNCSNLETLINAPLTITTIRSYEFQRCSKLDFSFLDFTKLTYIGGYGFAYNTGIPTNLMLLSCAQVDGYFLRDAGTHAVYMPSITVSLTLYHFGYAKLSILDLGENSTGYIGWAGLTGSPKIVLRANSVYKADGTTARYTMYNTGTIGKIYVYSDILDDFKALYTGVASKTYAIGGAEWVADFGSSDEWADYPNGVNPLTEENE